MTLSQTARSLLLAAVLPLALGACGDTLRAFLGTDDEQRLPGERISVLQMQQTLDPDPGIADLAVRLPRPYRNDEWPQAGGYPSHAMHHLEAPGPLDKLWQAKAGQGSHGKARLLASPIVAQGKVYVLDADGRLAALDAESGARLWRFSLTPEGEENESALGGGVAYSGGALFVATGFGDVFALNAETGSMIWRRRIGKPMRAAPTVSGGRVFVVTLDNELHALSTRGGVELWSHAVAAEPAGILGGASPAVDAGVVVAPYSSGELFALKAENGRVVWSDSLSRTRRLTPLGSLSAILGRPVIDRGRVYAISHSGRLAAIELRSGARLWERNIAGIESPWVAGDFIFLVTLEGEVVCLSRRDGRIRWVQTLQRYEDEEDREDPIKWTGPVLISDRLIVISSHGVAVSLSPYSGEMLGRIELPEDAFVPPVVANGTLFVLTDDGQITAFR